MDTTLLQRGTVRVLLVEDDEDDFIITRDLFAEIPGQRFKLDWVKSFDDGLAAMARNEHDIVLVDYRLGARNGVELLQAASQAACKAPLILLTGASHHAVDMQAMKAGADDYLVKTGLQAHTLERSVRYALQRRRAATEAAFEQARLAAFGAEVGLALTRRDFLDAILDRCSRAMAQYLGAALAQISIYDLRQRKFERRAVAGPLWDQKALPSDAAEVRLDLGSLSHAKPLLIPQLETEASFSDKDWIRAHGIASFAAYPLVLEDNLVGLMSIYSQNPLTEQILQEMGSVANGIALCVERKRSEQALDASEVKYRSVVENIKEVIFQLNEFGHWTFLNPAWTTVTGFDAPTSIGTFFLDYIYQEDKERDRHIFLQLVQGRMEFCRYETRLLTNDGKIRWVEVYLQLTQPGTPRLLDTPVTQFDDSKLAPGLSTPGSPGNLHRQERPALDSQAPTPPPADAQVSTLNAQLLISGTLTDITDRKQAEMQIQKLAAFPQVNPNPVLEFSADGTLSYANEAAKDTAHALAGNNLLAILPANSAAIVKNCIQTGHKHLREEVKLHDRTLVWSFFPVTASHVVHCYGADVTDILNLEAQFRHAQKLESVGQLAAGVAHDFNNILTVIQGYSETLLTKPQHDRPTKAALKQISEAAQRAASLTRQLLMFSRKQVIQPKVLDLNSVLQNVAKMLLRLLGEDVTLEAEYAPNLPRIEADTGMLEQIVMNLAVNARDAMPRGGKLTIRTHTAHIDQDYVAQRSEARAGHFVRLTVQDTGTGMDRQTLERIFEPFFSTKEVGKGTGLGLATVYGIVQQHEGWIEVESELGVGTRFDIFFPVAQAVVPAETDSSQGPKPIRGGNETILVVEDEPVLRELVREVLSQYEYKVAEANSGIDALRLWDEFNGEIDLLLTDMVMPEGMTGSELAVQLRSRNPALKVIYTSGYSAEIMGTDFSQPCAYFLPKPYFPPQLAQLVRTALDAPRPHQEPALELAGT